MGQRTRIPHTLWDEWMVKTQRTLNNSNKVANSCFSVTIYDSLLYEKLQLNIWYLQMLSCSSEP